MLSRAQRVALGLVVVAVAPYTVLKLVWLAGSSVGADRGAAAAELHSDRMVAGNVITIVLELLAVALAVALVRPWGRRAPAWVVVVLGAGATGLLVPILLGLTAGSVLQLAVTGEVRTAGMEHMSPWVFAVAYGGFGLLAIGMAVLAWTYVGARWGGVLAEPPRATPAWAAVGALGLLPFGTCMVGWGLLGPGEAGPAAMDTVSQRTVLVVTGLLALAAWMVPVARRSSRRPRVAWLVTWVGCATAALQCVTHVLLASDADPSAAVVLVACVTFPGSTAYGLGVLRGRSGSTVRGTARATPGLAGGRRTSRRRRPPARAGGAREARAPRAPSR